MGHVHRPVPLGQQLGRNSTPTRQARQPVGEVDPKCRRVGRARVMAGSAVLLIIPTGLVAVASTLPLFLLLRAVQGALMPGLLLAQQTRGFGLAQFTASACTPALHADITGVPNCRANNDRVLARVVHIKPDIVLLQGIQPQYLDPVVTVNFELY